MATSLLCLWGACVGPDSWINPAPQTTDQWYVSVADQRDMVNDWLYVVSTPYEQTSGIANLISTVQLELKLKNPDGDGLLWQPDPEYANTMSAPDGVGFHNFSLFSMGDVTRDSDGNYRYSPEASVVAGTSPIRYLQQFSPFPISYGSEKLRPIAHRANMVIETARPTNAHAMTMLTAVRMLRQLPYNCVLDSGRLCDRQDIEEYVCAINPIWGHYDCTPWNEARKSGLIECWKLSAPDYAKAKAGPCPLGFTPQWLGEIRVNAGGMIPATYFGSQLEE